MIAFLLAATIFMQGPTRLQPGTGVITGTLKVEGGASAAGIRVGAVATDDPTATSFLSVAETDSAGRFRLNNVPAGRYYIVAGRLDKLQFFPTGNSPERATEIVVEAAKIRSEVNFSVVGGSNRPPQAASAGSSGLNAMTVDEFRDYRQTTLETNVDKRLQALLAFEAKYPQSTARLQIYTSLMNAYVSRANAAKATEYGDKLARLDPNNVNSLILISRNFTILQISPVKAMEYAQKAATRATQLKGQSPQNGMDAESWRKWTTSMDVGAQANLKWVKQSAEWQQSQFLSWVRPRRQN
jgi:hypothetical protein